MDKKLKNIVKDYLEEHDYDVTKLDAIIERLEKAKR